MLKIRIIPLLILQDGLLKKPIRFKNPRTIANPISIVRVFEERQVDELILVDRGLTLEQEDVDPYLVATISEELYVPFAYGGGIKSIQDIKGIIKAGAEKVVINTAAVDDPGLLTKGAKQFGSQCIVVSIDAFQHDDGRYEVHTRSGSQPTGLDPVSWAQEVEKLGAGEILINSINHDGVMEGFDTKLIKMVSDAVSIPVIAAGGAGIPEHFIDAVQEGNASAVAAGSIFHYTKFTPNMIKGVLKSNDIPVRQYPRIDYSIT
jgi:imidazole glycerol-phosphate synthase subunit HisF